MRRIQGVVLVLLVVLVVVAGCSRGPSDTTIATDVKARMFSDPQVKAANIDVAAKDGEVTLTGEVPSDAARYQAFKLASETPGVRKVHDQMTVKPAELTTAAAVEPEQAPAPAPKPVPVRRAPRPALKPVVEQSYAPAQTAPAPAAAPVPVPAPAVAQVQAPAPPPEPKPVRVEFPEGTTLAIRMIDSVDSAKNQTGETFRASLDAPLMSEGEEVIPAGTDVSVRLVEAKSAGRFSGRSELRLELSWLEFRGKRYTLDTTTYEQVGTSRGKRTAAAVGGTAAVGAIIGAIAGGGKGAAIGAAAGAGAGGAVTAMSKGQQIRVPSETRLDFRLEHPLVVSYMPGKQDDRHRPSYQQPRN